MCLVLVSTFGLMIKVLNALQLYDAFWMRFGPIMGPFKLYIRPILGVYWLLIPF